MSSTKLKNLNLPGVTLPGVMVSIYDHGCLITGASGSGKSELALELLDRGHAIVADDAVEFSVDMNGSTVGRAPKLLQNRLHIRDLGVLDITQLYGQAAIKKQQKLNYIIELQNNSKAPQEPQLAPRLSEAKIHEESIPKLELSANNQRNLALILETFVKIAIMAQSGSHPAEQLLNEHQKQIEVNQR